MAVTLRIEEVVLHGFDPRDRHAIAEALREELGRLFAGEWRPSPGPSLRSGPPSPRARGEGRAEQVARAIAEAVHREVVR